MSTTAENAALGAALGLIYALYGSAMKAQTGEGIKPKKILRTSVLFASAGALTGGMDGQFSEGAIEAKAAALTSVGVIFDMAWGKANREGLLPAVLSDPIVIGEPDTDAQE